MSAIYTKGNKKCTENLGRMNLNGSGQQFKKEKRKKNENERITSLSLDSLQEQRHPFPLVCTVFSSDRTMAWLPAFESLTCAQMLKHATAHGGCTDTVRQSALEADSGRKVPCHTGDSSPRSYCAWLFSGSSPSPGVGGRSDVYEADFVGRQF